MKTKCAKTYAAGDNPMRAAPSERKTVVPTGANGIRSSKQTSDIELDGTPRVQTVQKRAMPWGERCN